jgi:hypothetical protein
VRARILTIVVVLVALGGFLWTRPLPRNPRLSAVGGVLTVMGAFWFSMAWISSGILTWLMIYDLIPGPLADVFSALEGHTPLAGLTLLGVALLVTARATRTRGPRRELVLYNPDDDAWFESPDESEAPPFTDDQGRETITE